MSAIAVVATAGACGGGDGEIVGGSGTMRRDGDRGNDAALTLELVEPTQEPPPPGLTDLAAEGVGEGLLYVPPDVDPAGSVPLVVLFHGAGGRADQSVDLVRGAADERGFVVLAPSSQAATWDVIAGRWGPDVASVERAMRWVVERVAVDPDRIAAAGFSDGASYALSLGLANGHLFTDVVAFSPGFSAPPATVGRPAVFVSHGTGDTVLPIAHTSRRLVPPLERAGYDVRYVEFEGGHTVPQEMLQEGFARLSRP